MQGVNARMAKSDSSSIGSVLDDADKGGEQPLRTARSGACASQRDASFMTPFLALSPDTTRQVFGNFTRE